MRVLIGVADTGRLRELGFSKQLDTSIKGSEPPKERAFAPYRGNPPVHLLETSQGIIVARKNGDVVLVDTASFAFRARIGSPHRGIVGILYRSNRYLIVADRSGKGTVFDLMACEQEMVPALAHFDVGWAVLSSFVGHPTDPSIYAFAGLDILPHVIRLEWTSDAASSQPGRCSLSQVWKARHPKNDHRGLHDPNKVLALAFIPGGIDYRLAATTQHGKLRIYDTTHGGRPVAQHQISKYPTRALAAFSETQLITADTQARQSVWTINPLKLHAHFKNDAGATEQLSVRGRYVAAGGLDRTLRVYEVSSRKPAGRIYVGEEITSVLILEDEDEAQAAEEQQIWDEIGSLAARKQKKSRVSLSASESEYATQLSDEEEDDAVSEGPVRNDSDDSDSAFEGFDDIASSPRAASQWDSSD